MTGYVKTFYNRRLAEAAVQAGAHGRSREKRDGIVLLPARPMPRLLVLRRRRIGRRGPAPASTSTTVCHPRRLFATTPEPKLPQPLRLLRPRAPVRQRPHVVHHALHSLRSSFEGLLVILQGGDATRDAARGPPARPVTSLVEEPLHVALEVSHPSSQVVHAWGLSVHSGGGGARVGSRVGHLAAYVLQVRAHGGVQRGEAVLEPVDVRADGV
mmetsp:Transcript_2207/g.10059  ORF Transcript_2207/g.10059 Transcript_2207/m.10059 type:complete len:213 (-) Transcript_2207:532-1170(-)